MTSCRPGRARTFAAVALLASAVPSPGPADEPPAGLPRGAIVAFLPDFRSGDYADAQNLRRWLGARGFALCDGTGGTPDLNYRMLLGTAHPEEAGAALGSRTHEHRLNADAGAAQGRERAFQGGRDQLVRLPDQGHRHAVVGTTEPAEHLPLSLRVVFIMKVR